MIILTDSLNFLKQLLGDETPSLVEATTSDYTLFRNLTQEEGPKLLRGEVIRSEWSEEWDLMVALSTSLTSQFDQLNRIDSTGGGNVPDRTIMVAGSGDSFHGYKGRSWQSPPGNLYLSVRFAPRQSFEWHGREFLALSALSMVESILAVAPQLKERVGVKWVNDILVDHSKIGGVITAMQTMGSEVCSAVVGIGMNVMTPIKLEGSDSFVDGAISLSELLSFDGKKDDECSSIFSSLFFALIGRLSYNYRQVIATNYKGVWERYCDYSMLIGREIEIYREEVVSTADITPIHQGRVDRIDCGLELYLEGEHSPITSGRIFIKG
jgi:biotin-[acetyl-CoA-carboxylase] ligase BirA-like protein